MQRIVPILAAALAVGLVACGGRAESSDEAVDGRLRVVTTISPLTNIVANVAGELAQVEGVVPEGIDAHTFEPAPSTARLLSQADVVFLNGLSLEEPTLQLATANAKEGARLVELGDTTLNEAEYIYDSSFPEADGDPNPHLWTNPRYARRYAELVMETLAERDPANTEAYRRNFERLASRFDELERVLATVTSSVPEANRKLVSYHDSFPYFARDFGWTIVGAIQPADFTDPTPRELAELIAQLRREGVPAIFGSRAFPSPILEQIARETDANYVEDLRDDDLPGEPGDPDHSLLALLQFDYTAIVDALGGDSTELRGFDATNPTRDEAHYPQ
jgi:ABC-type Zn uptake system ZnuABC Zn-binding protein ZnuA